MSVPRPHRRRRPSGRLAERNPQGASPGHWGCRASASEGTIVRAFDDGFGEPITPAASFAGVARDRRPRAPAAPTALPSWSAR